MKEIAKKHLNRINNVLEETSSKNDGLLGGKLGSVLYYYHSWLATGNKTYETNVENLIEEVFDSLNSDSPRLAGTAFSSGGAGLGYVVTHLSKNGFLDFDPETKFEELDKYLFNTALNQLDEDYIDYLHGALGVLHYLTERTPTHKVTERIDTIIFKLCNQAVRHDAGIWFKNFILRADDKENINFGLSHGLCGILLLLINAYPVSQHKNLIEQVVKDGIRFISKHKIDIDYSKHQYSFFPFSIKNNSNELTAPSRLAWCYGDLNEVLLFYRAGKLFNQPAYLKLGDMVGLSSLMRKEESATMISDAHFCHGASGLAQFYRILHQESGHAEYKKGYEYWIEQTVLLSEKDFDKNSYHGKEHDYLEGLLGIGFVLLSYISKRELNWSNSLLL
jgi:lantibiotic modifying enzyme